jgi:DnaJ like chaperone protein
LGVRSSDSNETIKAAYRRLATANHPDKVLHLGETAHKEAEKRFSKINESYNRIKKARKL